MSHCNEEKRTNSIIFDTRLPFVLRLASSGSRSISKMVQRADPAVRASSSPAAVPVPSKVIIIGAGWYGIAAAKTYLEVNPEV